MKCPKCGAEVPNGSAFCPECGVAIEQTQTRTNVVNNPPRGNAPDRTTAAILAILLGGIGIHWFYVGKTIRGVIALLFCWILIPCLIGLIKGIQWLVNDDAYFQRDIAE